MTVPDPVVLGPDGLPVLLALAGAAATLWLLSRRLRRPPTPEETHTNESRG